MSEAPRTYRNDRICLKADEARTLLVEGVVLITRATKHKPAYAVGDELLVLEPTITHVSIFQLTGYVADGARVTEPWEKRRRAQNCVHPRMAAMVKGLGKVEVANEWWMWAMELKRTLLEGERDELVEAMLTDEELAATRVEGVEA